jgi:hypothetical protein
VRIDPEIDYYYILGVRLGARQTEIEKAYRSLVKVHHPDRTGDSNSEQFKRITSAREILSSPELRARYDHLRWMASGGGSAAEETSAKPGVPDGEAGTRSRVAPRPVSWLDFGIWIAALPLGLAFWACCGGFFGGGWFGAILGMAGQSNPPLPVGLFAILAAVGYFGYWILRLLELRHQYRYYRAYVAASDKMARDDTT